MSDPTTCEGTDKRISSLVSRGGPTHFDWLGYPTTDPSGAALVRANLSARQARALGLLTSGTSGPPSSTSSASADLSALLASRLRQTLPGSTLYKLTWKQRVTPSQQSIYALRASAPRTSDNDSTGLPTPSGTSNRRANHVAGRLDEWGGSSNPFRGTSLGPVHSPAFELWTMGFPATWRELMPLAMPSSRRLPRRS